ncbi:Double-stranded RNA-binding protein 1 [Heracleum sosnowskyi]|uniref:Double-stranded RNA-binding protein 1 n=1 Tax=Heracleum sosnowskyi TaxID=360622 RepID=A0AAD8IIY1_9APIA|nr:Double-stranded RNA-binding protein 1 [Heracleum sosnowskyi]
MEAPSQSKSVVPQEALLFKNRLQEYAQKAGIPLPIYHTTIEGTPHAPMFRSAVIINGATYTSPNVFSHRKSSEMDAARIALLTLQLQIDEENCSLELEVIAWNSDCL